MSSSIGWLFSLLGLLLLPIAHVQPTSAKRLQFLALFFAHLAFTVVYAQYALANPADANMYYGDTLGWAAKDFEFGTIALLHVTQSIRTFTGGSFLDVFLVFQLTGFTGLVFLARTIEEIYLETGVPQPRFAYLIVFLPTLLFWTVAIGKDAPLFMACALAVWACRDLAGRIPALALAFVPMILFRPHIALITVGALIVGAMFDRQVRPAVKIVFALAILGSLGLLIETVETTLQVDVSNPNSISEFVAANQGTTGGEGAGDLPYPLRLLSLLFRPFFLDAGGVMGLVASFENIVMVVMVGMLVREFRLVAKIFARVGFFRFALTFAGLLAVLLALLYYNVGLGLRERTMMMPALITSFMALMAVRARSAAPRPDVAYA